jgi:hypothetical protein
MSIIPSLIQAGDVNVKGTGHKKDGTLRRK